MMTGSLLVMKNMEAPVKTQKRKEKEAVDANIYRDYIAMSQLSGSMQTEIKNQLALKYGYRHWRYIYPVIRRVEKRMIQKAKLQIA
jgi:hypothetical protein